MTTSPVARIGVFIVDDHPLIREGLALMLPARGFDICGAVGSVEEILRHPGLGPACVVVLDISLERASGVDAIPSLRDRGLRVVVYSMHEEPAVVRRALEAGASAYVTKREAGSALAEALRAVAHDRTYVSPRAAAALDQQADSPDLSPQQQQVYDLLGQGWDADEIAVRLQVSRRTVEGYCTRLMDKLGAEGMKELRRRAIADRQPGPV